MSASSFGCLHAVDRQRDSKHENGSISSELCRAGTHRFFARGRKLCRHSPVWHFSPNLSTGSALWEQHWGKCRHLMPVVGECSHPEVDICTVYGSTSEKRGPTDLDFAECYNWKALLPAGTLVEPRCCYAFVISFIRETERHLTILIFFQACVFLNEVTATMWRRFRFGNKRSTLLSALSSALWRIIAGEIKWKRSCCQWGTVEDVAAAGLMGDNRRTQSPGASLYRDNNRNLVWKSEPSQTWSQTICYMGPCEQIRTHTITLTSLMCVNFVTVTS